MNVSENLNGKKVLVTGGTGFIGGRLIEMLKTQYKVDVRVLVSNFSNVARIARFPIDMMNGDICNKADVEQAMDGCDYVFHCAYGNRGSQEERKRINVEGTQNILQASLKKDVKRVVYLSTIMVYGNTPDGAIDETAPRRSTGGLYSDSKLEAENLVNDFIERERLPATILQPTAVYGPYAPAWGIHVLDQLKTGTVMLINEGDGLCNGVYIDDMINAMLLTTDNKDAVGETFIISGDQTVTWKEFYGYFENMLGYASTMNISEADAIVYVNRLQTKKSLLRILREDAEIRSRIFETPMISNFKKAAMKFIPETTLLSLKKKIKGNGHAPSASSDNGAVNGSEIKPVHPMSDAHIRFFKSKTIFRIDKAKTILGYEPEYSFDEGMKLTRMWAEYSNLVDHADKEHRLI